MKTDIESYEKRIILIMIDEKCTFSEAMLIDFETNNLDTSSVFDLTDYLEEQLPTLDQVEYMMDIYVGRKPDMKLKAFENGKKSQA